MTDTKNNIIYAILLAVTFLAPIFFVPVSFISPQFGTSLLFAFGVIISILIYIVSALMSGELNLPKPAKYILGFTVLTPLVYTLSAVANGFSRMSFFGYTFDISTAGFIILAFCYLFLISLIFSSKSRIFYSYFAFVVSSIIFSLFLLLRIIFGAEVLAFGMFTDLTSTMMGSWNNVGIFFGITALLSLLTYEMINVSRFMKTLLSIALLLSLFFLALVNFSLIWMITAFCSFLFILYSLFSRRDESFTPISFNKRLKSIPLYSGIVLVVSVVFVIWGSSLGSYLSNTLKIANVEVRPALSVTLDIARETIKQRPLFGYGPNTFVTQWLSFKPDEIVSTIFWNTDFTNGIGLLPTFAVTTGIIGVLSWLFFLGFYVYLGVKSIFSQIADSFVKYLLTSSFFISLYLWIMTFVYMPSTVIFILTFFFTGLFFASVYLSGLLKIEPKIFSVSPRKGFLFSLFLVFFFVGIGALGYGLVKNSLSLLYFQRSFYALNTLNDSDLAENYMQRAINSVPMDIYYRSLSQIELLKLNKILSEKNAEAKPEDIQKQFSQILGNAIKAGIGARDADPSNYLNWIALGKVYEAVSLPELRVEGAYQSAQFAYTEALRRNPKNPGILLLFARLAVIGKDLKQAKNYVLQAIQTKKNYLEAYFLLSQIEVSDKNIKGAIDSTTAASVIDPTDPGIFFQLGLLKYNNKDFEGAISAFLSATKLTPNYANAKYFLGLSYDATGQKDKALQEFTELKITNPESLEIEAILANLKKGLPALTDSSDKKPERSKNLPVKEKR